MPSGKVHTYDDAHIYLTRLQGVHVSTGVYVDVYDAPYFL